MNDPTEPRLEKALRRYEVISAYIAARPGRGQKGPLLRKLADQQWTDEEGEQMGLLQPGLLRRSTLHRVLRAEGLSQRACRVPDIQDLDRREADRPNDLWQSDMLVGPWLPDPERPGKMRRAYLYAFLDDHSRLLLHGRFSFKGDLPALELVFRRCLQKYGVPVRVYYDNGKVYRSGHMKQIVAVLGIHGIVFTKIYRPQGHGKIEALNRYIRSAFLAELAAHRRPRDPSLKPMTEASAPPVADWLSHLVEQRREQDFDEPPPRQLAEQRAKERAEADQAIVELLRSRFDNNVIDDAIVGDYLDRFGPFDHDRASAVIERLLSAGLPDDIHITVVLDAIRDDAHTGGDQ